jgi:acyl-CoA reductase-like NAD-dependent aldehyde dehydrogenase
MKISHLIKDSHLRNKLFTHDIHQFHVINPVNNKMLRSYSFDNKDTIKKIIGNSHNSFKKWKNLSLPIRLEKMSKLANKFEEHKIELAKLITIETVKI